MDLAPRQQAAARTGKGRRSGAGIDSPVAHLPDAHPRTGDASEPFRQEFDPERANLLSRRNSPAQR